LLMLVGALDGRWPAVIRTWANMLQCRVGISTANRNEASRAARGDRRDRIGGKHALIDFWMAAKADHPGGPVHAAFIYNAPLFCGGLATEP
jgi:hypothetical protein